MSRNPMSTARKQTEKPLRFQFDIDPANVESFDLLMSDCGSRTRAELFNNAVTLLAWAVGEVQKGRLIASCDTEREDVLPVLLPALQVAARNAGRAREGLQEPRRPQARREMSKKVGRDDKATSETRDHGRVSELNG